MYFSKKRQKYKFFGNFVSFFCDCFGEGWSRHKPGGAAII